MKKRSLIGVCGFVLLVLIVIASLTTSEVYVRYCSPDQQFSISALKSILWSFIPLFPGHGGDAPGTIELYDEVEKRVLATASIDMVSRTMDLRWSGTTAYFVGEQYPNITEPWVLPRAATLEHDDQASVLCTTKSR